MVHASCSKIIRCAALIVTCAALLVSPAHAAWQNFRKQAGGLVDDYVLDIVEARDGAMWFATPAGVSRFDGVAWTTFVDSLPIPNVFALIEDREGRWWFGTRQGLITYSGGHWSPVDTAGHMVGTQINALLEDTRADVWIGTDQALSRYESGPNRWSIYRADAPGRLYVQSLFEDSRGNLWVSTIPGVRRLDATRTVWTTFTADPQALGRDSVLAIGEDAQGGVWFGTDQGAYRYRDNTWAHYGVTDGLPSNIVTAFARDSLGHLWIGTTGGLARFDGATVRADVRTSDAVGRSLGPVSALRVDRSGNAWIGIGVPGFSAGVTRYDGTTWRHWYSNAETQNCPAQRPTNIPWQDVLGSNCLTAACIDRRGEAWFGTESGGTGRLRANGAWTQLRRAAGVPVSDSITSIVEDGRGRLWLGSARAGVTTLDSTRTVWTLYRATDGLAGDSVLTVFEDHAEHVWVGTTNGASRWDGVAWSQYLRGGVSGTSVHVQEFAEDADGRIWIRTTLGPADQAIELPLYSVDPSRTQVRAWSALDGLANDNVHALLFATSGAMWFGTDAGASRFAAGSWTTWSTFGLPADPRVGALGEDVHGGIWAGVGYSGAARFDGVAWRGFNASTIGGAPVVRFFGDRSGTEWAITAQSGVSRYTGDRWLAYDDHGNGLSFNEVLAMTEDTQGRLWFATRGGLSEHEPDRVAPQTVFVLAPPVLSASRNASFAFGAAYGEANDLEFSTSWDGSSFSSWTPQATYDLSGVTDTTHTFQVRARDALHNVDPTAATYTFRVDATPPAAEIASPSFSQPVRGVVAVRGTTADARFKRFDVEARPFGATAWQPLGGSAIAVTDDTLAVWNTSALADGDWELRLSVTDTLGLVGISRVRVIVDNVAPFASVTSPVRIVARDGGDVYTTNAEVHLYFPPDGFDRDAIVNVDAVVDASLPDNVPGGGVRVGAIWDIGWSGGTLAKDAVLELRQGAVAYPSATKVGPSLAVPPPPPPSAIYVAQPDHTWRRLGGTRVEGTWGLELPLSAPGRYALFADATPGPVAGGVSALSLTPRAFSPRGAYARSDVAIGFTLARGGSVTVKVYNRAGRLVREVARSVSAGAGANIVRWDGHDDDGDIVAAGLYLVTVEALGETQTKTLAVVR